MYATQVWIILVPSYWITDFFTFDCRNWVFNNLRKHWDGIPNFRWKTSFMTTCWHLWNWRNKTIFEDNFQRPANPTRVIQAFSSTIEDCTNNLLQAPRHTETIFVGWKHPQEGWVKLNCDGACKENVNRAGCGGLLRDTNGKWLKEFVRKIGVCNALHAEMCGLYLGLELVWRDGVSHLCVEGDSKLLIDLVTNNCKTNGTTPSLMRRIRNLLDCSWHVEIIPVAEPGIS
jgi:hypothetical protein